MIGWKLLPDGFGSWSHDRWRNEKARLLVGKQAVSDADLIADAIAEPFGPELLAKLLFQCNFAALRSQNPFWHDPSTLLAPKHPIIAFLCSSFFLEACVFGPRRVPVQLDDIPPPCLHAYVYIYTSIYMYLCIYIS